MMKAQVSMSALGVRPISRLHPREMLLLAGSHTCEKLRSAAVRRAEEGRGALEGESGFWAVFAFTVAGTVIVCWVQQMGGCSGGLVIVGRLRGRLIEEGRKGQRILPLTAGQQAR